MFYQSEVSLGWQASFLAYMSFILAKERICPFPMRGVSSIIYQEIRINSAAVKIFDKETRKLENKSKREKKLPGCLHLATV